MEAKSRDRKTKAKRRAGIRQRSPGSDMTIEPLERGRKLEVSDVRGQSGG